MGFDFSNIKPEGYYLHLDKIVAATDLPEFIIRAGKELQESGYLTAGDFFEKLDDVEVLLLGVMMDSVKTDDFQNYRVDTADAERNLYHLSLICFVLALGEGIVELDTDFIHGAMQALWVLIAVENMYRRGAVQVFRENFSVVESFYPVAKVITGGKDENTKGA
jgi:hypothetical protein